MKVGALKKYSTEVCVSSLFNLGDKSLYFPKLSWESVDIHPTKTSVA